jgi:hypothetical protein
MQQISKCMNIVTSEKKKGCTFIQENAVILFFPKHVAHNRFQIGLRMV